MVSKAETHTAARGSRGSKAYPGRIGLVGSR